MKISALNKFLSFLILSSLIFVENIFTTPIDNRYDPVPFYTVFGMDKFYRKKEKFDISLNISPFYQSAAGSRNVDGAKVPEGDLFGRWNMLALFFGKGAAPVNKKFEFMNATNGGRPTADTGTNYGYLSLAHRVLDGIKVGTIPVGGGDEEEAQRKGFYSLDEQTEWERVFGQSVSEDIIKIVAATGADNLTRDFTDEEQFKLSDDSSGRLSIPIKYEKIGVRGQFNLDFGFGFGVNVKSGVVDCRQEVKSFNDMTSDEAANADSAMIKKYLTGKYREIISDIDNELNINIKNYHETAMEDTQIQLYWCIPFDLKDKEEEVIVKFAPYLSIGVWVPSGMKKDQDKAFSIPTGSDGYTGLSVDGALNFDFPRMVQLSFGAGLVAYGSEDRKNYYVPSSEYQMGLYPWKTDIRRRPGVVWYLNGSFMAKDFIDHFSFSFDYVYAQHNKDSITIRDASQTRGAAFNPAALEEVSKWKTQTLNCGLNYSITRGLDMGIAFQAHISGVRVYRDTTILGTISLNF